MAEEDVGSVGTDKLKQFGEHVVGDADVVRKKAIVVDVCGVGGRMVEVGFPCEIMDDRIHRGGHMAG